MPNPTGVYVNVTFTSGYLNIWYPVPCEEKSIVKLRLKLVSLAHTPIPASDSLKESSFIFTIL